MVQSVVIRFVRQHSDQQPDYASRTESGIQVSCQCKMLRQQSALMSLCDLKRPMLVIGGRDIRPFSLFLVSQEERRPLSHLEPRMRPGHQICRQPRLLSERQKNSLFSSQIHKSFCLPPNFWAAPDYSFRAAQTHHTATCTCPLKRAAVPTNIRPRRIPQPSQAALTVCSVDARTTPTMRWSRVACRPPSGNNFDGSVRSRGGRLI